MLKRFVSKQQKALRYFYPLAKNFSKFYEISAKLQLFAYKRYHLRMTSYSYLLEEEVRNEKSIQLRGLLESYGIGFKIQDVKEKRKIYDYEIQFYDFNELLFYFKKYQIEEKDIFAQLRNEYVIDKIYMKRDFDDNWKGNPTPIFNQVVKLLKDLDLYNELEKWFNKDESNRNHLLDACHWFKNTTDVKIWLNKYTDIDI